MSLNDEIRASQQKLQAEMKEAERKRQLEEKMKVWRNSTSLHEASSPLLVTPPLELQTIMAETLSMAKYNNGKIVSKAPNGLVYAREIITNNNSREYANMNSFDVILETVGTGKDQKQYSIWFFKNGMVCFVHNNSKNLTWNNITGAGFNLSFIRQKIIDTIALQGMDSKGNIKYTPNTNGSSSQKSEGCYIATAVYGSYDCPQVWVLRRYRDLKLKNSVFGRIFIKVYYAVSPTLVKYFGNKVWFIKAWKKFLNHKIYTLRNLGYSQERYVDE
jgi:hypothetical protein